MCIRDSDEYKKNNFNNAVQFYTEGIEVNCKDEELNAKLSQVGGRPISPFQEPIRMD